MGLEFSISPSASVLYGSRFFDFLLGVRPLWHYFSISPSASVLYGTRFFDSPSAMWIWVFRSKAIVPQFPHRRRGRPARARARGILSRTAGVSAPQACDQCPALVAQQSCAKESPMSKLCAPVVVAPHKEGGTPWQVLKNAFRGSLYARQSIGYALMCFG